MIEAWIEGRSIGTHGAGFAVRMTHTEDHTVMNEWIRTVLCEKMTTNQAELKGVEYVLKSIKDEFRNDQINIITASRYSPMVLERVGQIWTKNIATNIDLVAVVRNLYEKFGQIVIYTDAEHETMRALSELNEKVIKKNMTVFEGPSKE